jgi:predicted transcriptional regulator
MVFPNQPLVYHIDICWDLFPNKVTWSLFRSTLRKYIKYALFLQ